MMVLRTCGSDADKSRAAAPLAHFNALENLQTRTHRQGAGATMLIASVKKKKKSWAYRWWCYPGSSG
ncbi:hypothetical protein MJ524_18680 [Escherichia coli]|nr:hypothetical protein MJ524_18680 [Escherichia coli]